MLLDVADHVNTRDENKSRTPDLVWWSTSYFSKYIEKDNKTKHLLSWSASTILHLYILLHQAPFVCVFSHPVAFTLSSPLYTPTPPHLTPPSCLQAARRR